MISIITPTYNRLEYIKKLYSSLLKQTCFDFQWIVIDDGSEDETERWFDEIKANDCFDIIYEKKKNGGKHRALNASHKHIEGTLVMVVDSDDQLTEDAVETIIQCWEKYREQKPIMMIFQRGKMDTDHSPFDTVFTGEDLVTTLTDLTNRGFAGDHCEVVTSEEFRKYSFPEYDGEKFLGEAWLWQKIGMDGKCVFINKVVYLCEYIAGGLTQSGRRMRNQNPKGGQEHAKVFLDPRYILKIRFKNAILFTYYGRLQKQSYGQIMRNSGCSGLILFSVAPALLLKYKWAHG